MSCCRKKKAAAAERARLEGGCRVGRRATGSSRHLSRVMLRAVIAILLERIAYGVSNATELCQGVLLRPRARALHDDAGMGLRRVDPDGQVVGCGGEDAAAIGVDRREEQACLAQGEPLALGHAVGPRREAARVREREVVSCEVAAELQEDLREGALHVTPLLARHERRQAQASEPDGSRLVRELERLPSARHVLEPRAIDGLSFHDDSVVASSTHEDLVTAPSAHGVFLGRINHVPTDGIILKGVFVPLSATVFFSAAVAVAVLRGNLVSHVPTDGLNEIPNLVVMAQPQLDSSRRDPPASMPPAWRPGTSRGAVRTWGRQAD
eukprot:CAMPEP_0179369858 /NCGR_PEP_ID=MMETSP0797-20121207/84826_1 /TAXON_ID=47934 /ORGANISM="Dinophysis acuminata, Strain DAEP01" /LENGTH=323 /DNA_ID=CAMNT_0021085491 /DNA_START=106 /DNA_END=1080 /DNA_ORIENTATION=+